MRNIISNIAQVVILFLILPIFFPVMGKDGILNFIQGIPIFDTWSSILISYNSIDTSNLVWIYFNSFFEAIIMGICVHTSITVFKILNSRGLPILSTAIGVLIGSLIIKMLGIAGGFKIIIYIAIVLFGFLLMFKGIFKAIRIFSLKDVITIFIESILAVITCGFVVALTYLTSGTIAISKFILILVLTIIALILTYFATNDKKNR